MEEDPQVVLLEQIEDLQAISTKMEGQWEVQEELMAYQTLEVEVLQDCKRTPEGVSEWV